MVKFEKKILEDLYQSVNGLYAFTFYSRYKIEPDQIFDFIQKYEKKGILEFSSDKLSLTKEGRDIILKQKFVVKSNNGKFNSIPKEFLGEKIKINEPYLPNINSISAEILKEQKKEE